MKSIHKIDPETDLQSDNGSDFGDNDEDEKASSLALNQEFEFNAIHPKNKKKIKNKKKSRKKKNRNKDKYESGVYISYESNKSNYNSMFHEFVMNQTPKLAWPDFVSVLRKSMQMLQISRSLGIENVAGFDAEYNIHLYQRIGIQHVVSLRLYTNWTDFCTKFRESFRRLPSNPTELEAEIVKRHCNNYYWMGRFMHEAIVYFGDQSRKQTHHFHGVNIPVVFDKFHTAMNAPISTTMSLEKAGHFSKDEGVVCALGPKYTGKVNATTAMNVEWVSEYSEEREVLYFGKYNQFRFYVSDGKQQSSIFEYPAMFQYLEALLTRDEFNYFYFLTNDSIKNQEAIINQLINPYFKLKHGNDESLASIMSSDSGHNKNNNNMRFMPNRAGAAAEMSVSSSRNNAITRTNTNASSNLFAHGDAYYFVAFDHWCNKLEFVDLSCLLWSWSSMVPGLRNFFFVDAYSTVVSLDKLLKLFPNLKEYRDTNNRLQSAEVFEDPFEPRYIITKQTKLRIDIDMGIDDDDDDEDKDDEDDSDSAEDEEAQQFFNDFISDFVHSDEKIEQSLAIMYQKFAVLLISVLDALKIHYDAQKFFYDSIYERNIAQFAHIAQIAANEFTFKHRIFDEHLEQIIAASDIVMEEFVGATPTMTESSFVEVLTRAADISAEQSQEIYRMVRQTIIGLSSASPRSQALGTLVRESAHALNIENEKLRKVIKKVIVEQQITGKDFFDKSADEYEVLFADYGVQRQVAIKFSEYIKSLVIPNEKMRIWNHKFQYSFDLLLKVNKSDFFAMLRELDIHKKYRNKIWKKIGRWRSIDIVPRWRCYICYHWNCKVMVGREWRFYNESVDCGFCGANVFGVEKDVNTHYQGSLTLHTGGTQMSAQKSVYPGNNDLHRNLATRNVIHLEGFRMEYDTLRPRYLNLKTEILQYMYAYSWSTPQRDCDENILNAREFHQYARSKDLLTAYSSHANFGISEGQTMDTELIACVTFYTDFSALKETFIGSFNKLDENETEDNVRKRHCQQFYWLGRGIYCTIRFFGHTPSSGQKFYLPISGQEFFLTDSLLFNFEKPRFVSASQKLATDRITHNGILLQIEQKFKNEFNHNLCFDASVLSLHPEEQEILFFGSANFQIIGCSQMSNDPTWISVIGYFQKMVEQTEQNYDYYNMKMKKFTHHLQNKYLVPLIEYQIFDRAQLLLQILESQLQNTVAQSQLNFSQLTEMDLHDCIQTYAHNVNVQTIYGRYAYTIQHELSHEIPKYIRDLFCYFCNQRTVINLSVLKHVNTQFYHASRKIRRYFFTDCHATVQKERLLNEEMLKRIFPNVKEIIVSQTRHVFLA